MEVLQAMASAPRIWPGPPVELFWAESLRRTLGAPIGCSQLGNQALRPGGRRGIGQHRHNARISSALGTIGFSVKVREVAGDPPPPPLPLAHDARSQPLAPPPPPSLPPCEKYHIQP